MAQDANVDAVFRSAPKCFAMFTMICPITQIKPPTIKAHIPFFNAGDGGVLLLAN
jgi:hypothetical protein